MSLEKTIFDNVRLKYPSRLASFENRVVETGLLTAILEMNKSSRSIVDDDLKTKVRKASGLSRPINVPIRSKGNVTLKDARTCEVQCSESDSDMTTIVLKTLVADLCMVPGQYGENSITYEKDFAHKLEEIVEKFRLTLEEDIETALDLNKSQVYKSTIIGDEYALTGGAIQVQNTQRETFFAMLGAINRADDYSASPLKVIANHYVEPIVTQLMNPGNGAATNTLYQFPGKDFRFTNGIENGTGIKGTGYFMPDGAIGLVTDTDIDAKRKHTTTKGTRWFEKVLPGLPFPVGIKYDSECSDQTALMSNNLTKLMGATKIEHWQISFDYAIVVPYNSDLATKSSPIRKFEFV